MKVAQSCPTLCSPMDYTVHGILQARILQWVAFPFSRALPNPGIKPRVPTLQEDSLPAKPRGKSKNTRMGSLSLLQWIFPTQELNQGLLHCRWILYQLSYQGSPCRGLYVHKQQRLVHLGKLVPGDWEKRSRKGGPCYVVASAVSTWTPSGWDPEEP